MSEFWFVVKPTNETLYEALRGILTGRTGFHIIKDRRSQTGEPPRSGDRRTALTWEEGEIVIAEREGPIDD